MNILIQPLLFVLLLATPVALSAEILLEKLPATFKLHAGCYDRYNSPVEVLLSASISTKSLQLERFEAGKWKRVPCQFFGGTLHRLGFQVPQLSAGKDQQWRLREGTSVIPAKLMRLNVSETTLSLGFDCVDLVQYNIKPQPIPDYAKAYKQVVERTGYIHPLRTPRGEILTACHPKDHVHHLGLWHVWTHTTFDGKSVDFWNLKKAQGTVRFSGLNWKTNGAVFAAFSAQQEHVVLHKNTPNEVALNDVLTLVSWKPDATEKGYLLDYVSTQSCATNKSIVLGSYRYSEFGYRARLDWNKSNSDYLTSEGKHRKDANFTTPRWCRIEGKTSTGSAGILFMSHPKNRNYPEPIRTWDKQWIFFNINPIQRESITLIPGASITFRHRMYIYDGTLSFEQCEVLWNDFAHPIEVTL